MFHLFEEIGAVFCCENDQNYTFKKEMTIISAIVGYSRSELTTFCDIITPQSLEDIHHCFNEELPQVKSTELVVEINHKAGHKIWVLIKVKLAKLDDGKEYIIGTMLEISNFKRQLDTSNQLLKQYQIILSQTENIIFELDCKTDYMFFADTWYDIFGYEPIYENFIGTLASNPHIHPEDIPLLEERFRILVDGTSYKAGEVRIIKKDGEYLWCRIRATAIYDENGNLAKLVGVIINIDKEKRAENELKVRADQDSLTLLLNKQAARHQSELYFKSAKPDEHCAFLFLDLDNFKDINDHYGHIFGDQILIKVANEIKKLFRTKDIIARLGGDEFMILMKNVNDIALVEKRCTQLLEAFDSILAKSDFEFTVGASIGVAYDSVEHASFNRLFDQADQASYVAKKRGRHQYAIYTEE